MDTKPRKSAEASALTLQTMVRGAQARNKVSAQSGFLKESGHDGKCTSTKNGISHEGEELDFPEMGIETEGECSKFKEAEDSVGVLFHNDVMVMEADGITWRPGYATLTKTRLYIGDTGERILQNGVGRNILPSMLYKGEIPSLIFSYLGPASFVLSGLAVRTLELGDVPLSSGGLDDLLEVLPDDARRSRHSKIFPLRVTPPSGGRPVILATETGRRMWDLAFALYWRGNPPRSTVLFDLPGCDTYQNFHNPVWVNPRTLQRKLLRHLIRFLPGGFEPLRVGSIVRLPDGTERTVSYVFEDGEIEIRDGEGYKNISSDVCTPVNSNPEISVRSDGILRLDEAPPNAGRNFVRCLVGACVHGGEKNMEMLLSLELIDGRKAAAMGNSPLSMCLEGKYTPERTTMAVALMNQGAVYPAVKAGYGSSSSLIYFLCKPKRIMGLGPYATIGEAVHPDDKKLVKVLKEKGVGSEFEDDAKKRIATCLSWRRESLDMRNLASVYNGRDGLTTLPCDIASLSNFLTDLDLSQNVITELPEEFFKLALLKSVNLNQNCLLEVSPKFKDLANLQELDIRGNLVEKLPVDLLDLKAMRILRCCDNPIKWPPEEIWGVRENDDALGDAWARVRDFFCQVVSSGQTENVSTKVMVLGRSECGKTSLINALVLEYSKLARKGDRTLGIEQRHWQFSPKCNKGNARPLELSVFDFAGQEEYYTTHHMYMTSRALYVVAFDLSKCEDEACVEEMVGFYIDLLQTRLGGSAPGVKVLVVGTHADEIESSVAEERCAMVLDEIRHCEQKHIQTIEREIARLKHKVRAAKETKKKTLDARRGISRLKHKLRKTSKKTTKAESEEQRDYIARLVAQTELLETHIMFRIKLPDKVYAISSAPDLYGIPDFRTAVEVAVQDKTYFPQMNESIPLFYDNLRTYIRDQRRYTPYCSWDDYLDAVRKNLGSNNQKLDPRSIHTATLFMHDLGELLFPIDSGTVFLDVSWLVDTMKQIIRHDHQETLVWKEGMDTNLELFMRDRLHFEDHVKTRFINHGELPVELLRYLWSNLHLDEDTFRTLVSLLEKFEILVPVATADVGTHKLDDDDDGIPQKFLVPTFMPHKLDVAGGWPASAPDGQNQVARIFSCGSTSAFPAAMMPRLQVLLCKEVPTINLTRTSALATWDDHQCNFLVELMSPYQLRLTVRGPPSAKQNTIFHPVRKLTALIKRFFEQWPGMVTFEYAQYEEPKTGNVYMFRLDDIEQKLAEGCEFIYYSTTRTCDKVEGTLAGGRVKIQDLLDPDQEWKRTEDATS